MDYLSLFKPVPATVYKDDCGYCFRSMYNNDNEDTEHLNICLDCYQSFCGDHLETHLKASENSHKNYISVKKVKKDEQLIDDEQKLQDGETSIKKIKLEVKNEPTEEQKYEVYWSIVTFNENGYKEVLCENTSSVQDSLREKVISILNKKDQLLQEMSNAWELEINTCTHIHQLEEKIIANTLVLDISTEIRCGDCALKDNLWLCLECGNLGCGREQVGIEGNSHAVNHNKNTKHPLAVKLGSLTKDSRDIYCYACDDEVKFEESFINNKHLEKYLQNLNLDKKEQTEKSLTELNVEQNMNWDFQMKDSEGNELRPLEPNNEIGCGMINLGNSCYLNSVIQSVLSLWAKEYNGDLASLFEFPKDVVYVNTNFKCQFIKLFKALTQDPFKYKNGIRPTLFKKMVGGTHEEFKSGRQQDAMEYFTYILNLFDKKLFSDLGMESPNNIFRFVHQEKLKCRNCQRVKFLEEPAENLQIPLVEDVDEQSFLERILDYFQGDGNIDFKCPHCGISEQMQKIPYMKSFPKTLVLNPTRLKLVNWQPVKTSSALDIPDRLDLLKFKSPGVEDGEVLFKENENDDTVFTPNSAVLNQLIETGFSENSCKRALYNTGNTSDPDIAMEWIFQNMEDSDFNENFVPPSTSTALSVDSSSLASMVSMGLSEKLCKKALILSKGDVNMSIEWVFSNMDDDGEIPPASDIKYLPPGQQYGDENGTGMYSLNAVICHKGNSAHSGHYVTFLRKNIDGNDSWVLYNDEKMVVANTTNSWDDIKKNGYIFFYTSV